MISNLKDKIKTSIAGSIVLLLIFIAIVITLKYNVEGETNMPFKLNKIVIGSMVVGSDNSMSANSIQNDIVQNNGVYFEIKKNENYKKDAVIDSVNITNIKVTSNPKKGNVKIYMPNTTENKKFTYSDEFVLENNSLTYKGGSKTDTTTLQINNQGGIIAVAFGNTSLGSYNLTDQDLVIDGTILTNMGISDEDIKFSVNFDLIIISQGKKFKANINLDLPPSEITSIGKSSLEITDTSKFIFKRIND